MATRLLWQLTLLLAIMTFFSTCSWDVSDDENYVELTRPPESIPVSVDLSGANPKEVIYLPKQIYMHYTLNVQNKPLLEHKLYLDEEELTVNKNEGYKFFAFINKTQVYDKIQELKLSLVIRTNSGSIADLSGAETYIGDFIYKIKIIETENVNFNITQTLDEGKHLKLEWEKPKNFEVDRYEIYTHSPRPSELRLKIDDPDQTYFVDKDYSSGNQRYEIRVIPKNNIGIPYIMNDYTVESK